MTHEESADAFVQWQETLLETLSASDAKGVYFEIKCGVFKYNTL